LLIPQISQTMNGTSLNSSCRGPASPVDRASTRGEPAFRRLSPCCGQAAKGGSYPTTARSGKPCITPFGAGAKKKTWERRHAPLRDHLRVALGREAQPSAGIIDSQSVKTTGVGGERGYDGAKTSKGRKRHRLVDTPGWLLTVQVHPADGMDRDGVPLLLPPAQTQAQLPRLAQVWLEAGDNGTGQGKDWMEKTWGWTTTTVRPPSRRVLGFAEVEPAPRPACTV
jgi:Transposase DDE domain